MSRPVTALLLWVAHDMSLAPSMLRDVVTHSLKALACSQPDRRRWHWLVSPCPLSLLFGVWRPGVGRNAAAARYHRPIRIEFGRVGCRNSANGASRSRRPAASLLAHLSLVARSRQYVQTGLTCASPPNPELHMLACLCRHTRSPVQLHPNRPSHLRYRARDRSFSPHPSCQSLPPSLPSIRGPLLRPATIHCRCACGIGRKRRHLTQ